MKELANCPRCGGSPFVCMTMHHDEFHVDHVSCCGAQFDDSELWEHYATASALKCAMGWERECEVVHRWADRYRVWPACIEAERIYECARAEVDRLLSE